MFNGDNLCDPKSCKTNHRHALYLNISSLPSYILYFSELLSHLYFILFIQFYFLFPILQRFLLSLPYCPLFSVKSFPYLFLVILLFTVLPLLFFVQPSNRQTSVSLKLSTDLPISIKLFI